MNTPNYNDIIKTTRKAKGLTQQQLADETGLSLRTIQRIEKGTEEISGYSLNQISKVLDIPLEQIIMQNVDNLSIDTNQIGSIRNLYLSSLSFVINPLFGFLVPFIIGYSKQDKSKIFEQHLKKIIKYHGFYLILIIILFIIMKSSFYFNKNGYYSVRTTISSTTIVSGDDISSGIFFWKIFLFFSLLYIPISVFWTFIQYRKLIKSYS